MSSSSSKSPAFQFYPNDFTGSGKVGTMTAAEVGVYVLLLCLDWNENGFQEEPKKLARWCRMSVKQFKALWPTVRTCFEERDGRMFNPRLELEREKQRQWREKSSAGGKKSAQGRLKGGSTVVEAPCQPNGNTQSQSSSPVTTTTTSTPFAASPDAAGEEQPPAKPPAPRGARREYDPAFVAFWEAYPKAGRVEKVKAAKAWGARMRDGFTPEIITAGLARYVAYLSAMQRTPKHAATFVGPDLPFLDPWVVEYTLPSGKSALQELEELGQQDPWWTEGLRAGRAVA